MGQRRKSKEREEKELMIAIDNLPVVVFLRASTTKLGPGHSHQDKVEGPAQPLPGVGDAHLLNPNLKVLVGFPLLPGYHPAGVT